MQQRMMCTDCLHVAVPDTVLEGSDLLELLGWLCFGIPGLLYCWWRHLNRIKVCPQCGSGELVREARAAAERRGPQAPPSFGPRIVTLSGAGQVHWPRALSTPRARLRSGSVGAPLLSVPPMAWMLATLGLATPDAVYTVVYASSLLWAWWLFHQVRRVAHLRSTLPGCRAWDQHGRPLRIERI